MEASSSSTGSAPPNPRSARGSIAAQACETCRARKQKCDEARPKCSLCSRMKLECRYREPVPTKKDKTLVEILDRLKSLEGKVDRIPTSRPQVTGFGPPQPAPSSQPSFSNENDPSTSYSASALRASQLPSPSGQGRNQSYRHNSAGHKILTWPAIQQLLLQLLPSNVPDLKSLEQEGSDFLVRTQEGLPNLSLEESLHDSPFIGMQSRETRVTGGVRRTFPALTRDVMHQLATNYFDTFNLLYPFMDRQNFLSDTLARVHSEGFDGEKESVIALLVFALGKVAMEGSSGQPIGRDKNGRESGIRGGSAAKPPGLDLFNEARKRVGFVLTDCDLENVQIFSLMAFVDPFTSDLLTKARNMELTHLQIVLPILSPASGFLEDVCLCFFNPIDWNSPRGDLIRRAFWHCAIIDSSLNLDLGIPPSARLISLEDRVGMPSFNTPFCEADHAGNQSSHFLEYYASCTALRRLCTNIHSSISESVSSSDTPSSGDDFGGPPASTLNQLAGQLNQFRSMLPQELQWRDDDPISFPSPQKVNFRGFNAPLDPSLPSSEASQFSLNLDIEPARYPYVYDVQVALLRTRYYHVKYMIFRPFIYKALHFPGDMSREDAAGAAECLMSCLQWPITLSPTSRKKRLIPYMYCWSQTFLGILLIFHMTRHNSLLRDIRSQLCGQPFENKYDATVELMIDWIKDLRQYDAIAAWCYKILQPIYNLDP